MIDVVIAYVDSSDENWIKSYCSHVKKPLENAKNRFRSYGCLDLQIKLIRTNMKFVNNIFVVVSNESQVPENIKKMSKVNIVLHSEIIPKRYLPCFNSCTIEMHLGNIKKLSDKFIYFNDDIFPIRKLKEQDFFVDNKITINFNKVHYDENNANSFQKNVINSTRLFLKNATEFIKPAHSCFPAIKSHINEITKKYNDEINSTLTRTRTSHNINFYAFVNYEIFNENYVNTEQNFKYFSTLDDLKDIYDCIKSSDIKIICMNDNDNYNFDEWKKEFRNILECSLDRRKTIHFEEKNNKFNGISICISAYKAKYFIKECLDSIQNQTYFINNEKNYEILLGIDGCEETLEYINSIKNNYINLRVFMMDSNKGTYITSNTLMNNIAKYDWLLRFDADDIMNNEFIEEIVKAIKNNDFDICRYYYKDFNNYDKIISDNIKKTFGSICIKRDVFKKIGGYRPWVCAADSELLDIRTKFFKTYFINKDIFKRRIHSNNLTIKRDTNFSSKIRKKYIDFIYNEKINTIEDCIINCETNTYKEIIDEKIIVSFTTWKNRDKYVKEMLRHFKNQTIKPYKIICWIAKDEYNSIIPDTLKECLNENLLDEICWTNTNIYGHKRYEVFKKYNDYYIATIDDDLYYPENYLSNLLATSKKYPNCIISYFSRTVDYCHGKRINKQFNNVDERNEMYSGLSLYPPFTFPIESFKYTYLRDKYCLKCDDSWINAWLKKKNILVAVYKEWYNGCLNVIDGTANDGIWITHNNIKINGDVTQLYYNRMTALKCLGLEDVAKKLWPNCDIDKYSNSINFDSQTPNT